jgi:hypothetical protein
MVNAVAIDSCSAFEGISPNVLEESAVSDDLDRLDEEGVCSHEDFSVKGLIKLLKATAWSFSQAKMFETVAKVAFTQVLLLLSS